MKQLYKGLKSHPGGNSQSPDNYNRQQNKTGQRTRY